MFVSPLSAPVRITDIVPSQDYATYENEAISLACYIAGDPTPTVSWEKVGGNIYNKYKTKEALLLSALMFPATIHPSARKDFIVTTVIFYLTQFQPPSFFTYVMFPESV